jgi:signal transduction histidine kinase
MTDYHSLRAGAVRLRFAPPLEAQFRADYFENSLVLARAALAGLMLMWVSFGVLDIYTLPVSLPKVWMVRYGVMFPLWFIVLLWSFHPSFSRAMQISISLLVFAGGCSITAMTAMAQPEELGHLLYYSGLILAPLCGYSFLRLRFWFATVANFAVLLVYLVTALGYQRILEAPQGATILINNLFFVVGANIAGMATCYSLEYSARRAFIANYLLEEERLGEQRKREHTEAMLQILSQAIGGVVHDLGNPLTSVQTGVQTLELVLKMPQPNQKTVWDLISFIDRGAQMLNALRLSLMEQTRVLEGKPTPVDLHPTPIRAIVEAAASHQDPRYRGERPITLSGPDCEVVADEMKLTTVFMNLIGNALKYSEGEVHIGWHIEGTRVLIAVSDQGHEGRGITQEQAQRLFVAFSRLEAHSKVQGTGLGLLSVRHILSAHGGEVFIEGTLDGTADSAPFSTAETEHRPVRAPDFRTAFVVTCPLALPIPIAS